MSTPFAGIICREHGHVDIDIDEYNRQLARPWQLWVCPICHQDAFFDDERFEAINFPGK